MIVADVNLIAALVFESPTSHLAESVFASDPQWTAPHLWRSELLNILATQNRVVGMPVEDAIRAYDAAESVIIAAPDDVEAATVLRLASQHRLTAYDSEYFALALLLGIRLVTFDTKLRRAASAIAFSPEEFLRSTPS
jgi:predicted nucleic acid-binding protein